MKRRIPVAASLPPRRRLSQGLKGASRRRVRRARWTYCSKKHQTLHAFRSRARGDAMEMTRGIKLSYGSALASKFLFLTPLLRHVALLLWAHYHVETCREKTRTATSPVSTLSAHRTRLSHTAHTTSFKHASETRLSPAPTVCSCRMPEQLLSPRSCTL